MNVSNHIEHTILQRMPVLFVGHGNPMNAIEDNEWSRGFSKLASYIQRPKAILSVSAHWFIDKTQVTSNLKPRTIHDFGGFPQALYEVQYPVEGDLELANKVMDILGRNTAFPSDKWGIDHGTWSVLHRMYPKADIPVIQLSIDASLTMKEHLEIGKKLAVLREQDYLILGSGNITHNLRDAFSHMASGDRTIPSWAVEFDKYIAGALVNKSHSELLSALDGHEGRQAHPTPDHYIPLLYAAGASVPEDMVQFPITGFDLGSLSMRIVIFGN